MERVRWDDLAAFLAVAKSGGLAAGAREMNSSAPTMGRRMQALERALGRELFIRHSHGYELTEAGQGLLSEVDEVAGRIDRILAPVDGGALPLVKLSAGSWTTLVLAQHFDQIAGTPVDVQLRFVASEAVLSIAHRQAYIGIRNRRPSETGLAGRKLAKVEFAIYAMSEKLTEWITVDTDTPSAKWGRARAGAEQLHEVNHPRIALDLALQGAGRVVLPSFIGDMEPKLKRLSNPIDELTHEAWLVVHDDDRHLPEVRRVIERVAKLLS